MLNKKKILAALAPWLTATPIHRWLGAKWSGVGTILMFHRIVSQSTLDRVHNHESLEIDANQLEATILFFKERNYDLISLDQLCDYTNSPTRKFVVFTFDDGYIDNLTYALPIFKKHQVPFTIFVTNNFINRSAVIWWYILEEILRKNDTFSISWRGKYIDNSCKSKKEKENVFTKVRNLIINELDSENHLADFEQLFSPYCDDLFEYTNQHILTWDQVRQLSNNPLVTIAAHTLNHLPLCLLSSQQLTEETVGSRDELQNKLSKEIKYFAYPFGKEREAHKREYTHVRDHGFTAAVTTNLGNVLKLDSSEMHSLPRINVNMYTTAAVLELHVSGFITFLKRLKLNF